MVMFSVVEDEPTELFAQITYTSPAIITLGVPQIVPFVDPIFMPLGSIGSLSHEVMSPLVEMLVNVGYCGEIAVW